MYLVSTLYRSGVVYLVSTLFRSGVVYLQDCEVDIDGETELEKNNQLELANITFKSNSKILSKKQKSLYAFFLDCSVSIKNLKIQSEVRSL